MSDIDWIPIEANILPSIGKRVLIKVACAPPFKKDWTIMSKWHTSVEVSKRVGNSKKWRWEYEKKWKDMHAGSSRIPPITILAWADVPKEMEEEE